MGASTSQTDVALLTTPVRCKSAYLPIMSTRASQPDVAKIMFLADCISTARFQERNHKAILSDGNLATSFGKGNRMMS